MKKIIKIILLVLILAIGIQMFRVNSVHSFKLDNKFIEQKNELLLKLESSDNKEAIAKQIFDLDYQRKASYGLQEKNDPYFLQGSNKCILLTHGFTASGWETKPLGDYLHKKNYTVLGVLMEGHGVSKSHLSSTKWTDWYESVKLGYNILEGICDKIYVGGVSTGGAMALRLASEYEIDGVVSIASVTDFTNKLIKQIWWLKYIKGEVPTALKEFEKGYYYDAKPTPAIHQLVKFVENNNPKIKDIDEPIIIIQSENDTTADPSSLNFIYDNVQSSVKEKIVIPGNLHVLTTSENNTQIFDQIYAFLQKIEN